MSYTYLQEQGEESLAVCYSDIPAYVLSKLNLIADKFYCNVSAMESCQNFQSGTTCEPLTETLGEERSILSAEDSPAKILVLRERAQESTASVADYGLNLQESLAKFDPATHLWKTLQCSLFADLDECLETFPKWGIMLHGVCWAQTIAVRHTTESEFGFWLPTPRKSDGSPQQLRCKVAQLKKVKFSGRLNSMPYLLMKNYNLRLSPMVNEWAMGWPLAWTDLAPLETDKFQSWRQQHSIF